MKRATLGFMTIVAILSATAGADTFGDGGTYNVTSDVGSVYIWDATTVNFLTGSEASSVRAYNHSQVNINDGHISSNVYNRDQSTIIMNGGEIGNWVYLYDDSQFTLNDGTIKGGVDSSSGNSRFTMQGGTIEGNLNVYNLASIYGGSITDTLGIYANARVDIYGSSFSGLDFGTYSGPRSGTLYGVLCSGEQLCLKYYLSDNTATLALHDCNVVPLPGAMLLGGLGLSVAGWRLRRRES